ncbi:hypothetical protein RRG08_016922 [Elysia crispata]|uniref:Uncharacterized protein n=1 Tax=Elysia crispata TaxID=231223 RepID=A0AAE0ZLA2_9GAST|nr:hypothetical protein RRG08_016922 [Elysia crispata]
MASPLDWYRFSAFCLALHCSHVQLTSLDIHHNQKDPLDLNFSVSRVPLEREDSSQELHPIRHVKWTYTSTLSGKNNILDPDIYPTPLLM